MLKNAPQQLRTLCWYEWIKKMSGKSDYRLSLDFDPSHVTGDDRKEFFERVRHTLPKISPATIKFLDEQYPGTAALYESPYWKILSKPHMHINEVQEMVLECFDRLNIYNLKKSSSRAAVPAQLKQEIAVTDNGMSRLIENAHPSWLELRFSIGPLINGPCYIEDCQDLARYLNIICLHAALYRFFIKVNDLERAMLFGLPLWQYVSELKLVVSPLGSELWRDLGELSAATMFDVATLEQPKVSFAASLKNRVTEDSVAADIIHYMDSYNISKITNLKSLPSTINTMFQLPAHLKAKLQIIKGKISAKPISMNTLVKRILDGYFEIDQELREPLPLGFQTDLEPFPIRLPRAVKMLVTNESIYWQAQLNQSVSQSRVLISAIEHYLDVAA